MGSCTISKVEVSGICGFGSHLFERKPYLDLIKNESLSNFEFSSPLKDEDF
jgi:hypothetical protein